MKNTRRCALVRVSVRAQLDPQGQQAYGFAER